MSAFDDLFVRPGGPGLVCNTPPGLDALLLAQAAAAQPSRTILHVVRDDARLARTAELLAFFAPDLSVLALPAWDCQPYDRVSPRTDIESRRLETLAALALRQAEGGSEPAPVLLATVNALLQRVPPRARLLRAVLRIAKGDALGPDRLTDYLAGNGYNRSGTVVEPGEYAVRGGIVDLFPPGATDPVRLDFFGETVDELKRFDVASQRSTMPLDAVHLTPVGEVFLDAEAIERFERGYRAHFGAVLDEDPLFEAIRSGRKYPGMEHWLPLFHDRLETVFDYLPGAAVTLDHLALEARDARLAAIADHFEARRENLESELPEAGPPYKPLPPHELYLDAAEWDERLSDHPVVQFSPFGAPEHTEVATFDAGGRAARDFAPERTEAAGRLYDSVAAHAADLRARGKRVVIAGYTTGSVERLKKLLADHGLAPLADARDWRSTAALPQTNIVFVVLGLEHGFETAQFAILGEQDILGDRLTRPSAKRRHAENFLADVNELGPDDLVVHIDHGIGRFTGLKTLQIAGAPHDCLRIVYEGGDKLFVPVENIEVLSRFGPDQAGVPLDRLGGAAWQARTARLKRRILEMADELVRIAAERKLRPAPKLVPSSGLYEEFCARFPYAETEDQARAIAETLEDLARGAPMDRLICGDVGFGKTEVALRAAFVAAASGRQVALVVPTTLLCRQHFKSFVERFAGFPVRIEQLSRMVSAKRAGEIRDALASGEVDIVIGTHALLGRQIAFRDLALLIVDEEQHFGVAHKERLKRLKTNVHVLTMTATPIPRTLQIALAGVREMSVIATPPVDRLAIRTYILPYDAVVVREAILREHYRGGQTFYVCPRISDIEGVVARIRRLVPEVKVAFAHGRVPAARLDEVMGKFYDGAYDVLVVTSIIESGLDVPRTNTMIVHRADMFGLAQLYQLRGRIGRSKVRAYAYLTLERGRSLTAQAEKRLEVLHKLDSLGAGFSLASHDLDIRGAGNLLGREQSGHIREVGIELYQHMIEQAVFEARARLEGEAVKPPETWSPQINIGAAVLIPESYVPDLGARLALYRRIVGLETRGEIDAFAAELADRFGPVPREVNHLLEVIAIKQLCRQAWVARIEGGPKGVAVAFRNNEFPNPERLIAFIADPSNGVVLRPDSSLLLERAWATEVERFSGVSGLLGKLTELARGEAEEGTTAKGEAEEGRKANQPLGLPPPAGGA